ncbi:MAG: adenylosuccinate synthase [Chloroflexi bacterium]|nr:adenylosuccinate synthase [Chloroflexota bacterium]
MPVVAVIGAQWGDEGKGKIVDLLAQRARVVARCTGGNNAGHTIINELGEFKLNLVPAGIFNPRAICVIGNGVAADPLVLTEEMDRLRRRGVDLGHLFISDRAHVIMPYHRLLDALEEDARGAEAIGTTRKGVGPAFADKAARVGIRMGDLTDDETLLNRLSPVLAHKNRLLTKLYNEQPLSLHEVYSEYRAFGKLLAPHIIETSLIIQRARERNELILLEGAQGTLLDADFGTYPYVTSSSPTAAGLCLGVGLPPTALDRVIGVFKAYTTRVGHGPMPTELLDDTGQLIRERAHEYGTTTGRARRCGWFDAVVARYSHQINGYTSIALTRLDVLDELPTLKICTGYRLDGDVHHHLPGNLSLLKRVQPVYEEMHGWQTPTTHARTFEALPQPAQDYVTRLAELVGCTIAIVSVGPERDQTIMVKPTL